MSPKKNFLDFDLERLIREVNILLISDLHYDLSKTLPGVPPLALKINEVLVNSLPDVNDDWEPDIVIVAGDLVNHGKEANYCYYFDLLEKITQKYKNLKNAIFSTPGNHDINRENIVSSYNYLYSNKNKFPTEKIKNSYTSNDIINTVFTVSQYDLNSKKKKGLIEFLKAFEKDYFKTYLEMREKVKERKILNNVPKIYPVNGLSTVYLKEILGVTL